MTTVTFISPDGTEHVCEVPEGTSLMQAAVSRGLAGIVGECGGGAMCATCHVYVEAGDYAKLTSPDGVENEMLDGTACERKPNSRLSCQIKAKSELDVLRVYFPERQI